jgi:hypothetical protein
MSGTMLEEATTDQMIAELKKRNLACVIAAVRIGSNNNDEWVCSLKGSEPMLKALTAFSLEKVLESIMDKRT